jgi:hypothetical protein
MNRLLQRQLKRLLGLGGEEERAAMVRRLSEIADGANIEPPVRQALAGLGSLIEAVDAAYDQHDRDLELRTRSLDLSSEELTGANERLRWQANSRQRAIDDLKRTANALLASLDRPLLDDDAPDLERLSTLMVELVQEREEAQIALQVALNHLRNQKFALDQHAIVSITDTSGTIVYANDRFCAVSGYTRDELVGSNHRLVNSGLHPPEFFRQMWQTIGSGKVWAGEICNRAKDGRQRWFSSTIMPLFDEGGRPEQFIAIRTDITERKEVEHRLEEQLHFSQQLIEAIPIPIYFKDTEGRYLGANRAFGELVHADPATLIGKTVFEIIRSDLAKFHDERDRELYERPARQSYEVTSSLTDGATLTLLYHKASLTRPDGSVRGLIGAIIDLTQRKEWEDGLLAAKEAAEAANRAKSEFLANMSHEIRTPMNGIIGMTNLALDTPLSAEQREYVEIVRGSAESLLTIINDILDFSKIEAGKLVIETTGFDPVEDLRALLKPLQRQAEAKGLAFHLALPGTAGEHRLGDPVRLRQILVNLVSNAIKFTERGDIRVSLEFPAPGQARYRVSDTGIGVAAGKQEEIFDAFSQADTSTTRRFGGTGLGLAICRRLIGLMSGSIGIESELGKGSSFFFTVPLPVADPAPARTPGDPADGETAAPSLRVLLAEDNPVNQKLVVALLKKWGHQVAIASNGREAIALYGSQPFDLILMDMQMPDMGGLEATAAIRAREADQKAGRMPIVALTANAMAGDRERCLAAGMDDYLTKPIRAAELQAALARWNGERRHPEHGERTTS